MTSPLLRIFVDTSAFFALIDSRDQNHHQARLIQERLIAQHARLFTTNFVIAESHALLLARLGRAVAAQFLRALDESTLTIIRVTASDEQRARALVYRYHDKDFSLTDAISFTVMERYHLGLAFAFDHHFAQYGLALLQVDER